MSETRRPRGVYDHGSEPDPRFSLANERTFLAWIRTTIALLVAAAALDVVELPVPAGAQRACAAALALLGAATAMQSFFGWARTERAMRLGSPLPANPMALPLVAVLVLVAAAMLLGALLWRG